MVILCKIQYKQLQAITNFSVAINVPLGWNMVETNPGASSFWSLAMHGVIWARMALGACCCWAISELAAAGAAWDAQHDGPIADQPNEHGRGKWGETGVDPAVMIC